LLPGSGIDLEYYRAEPLDAERRPFTFLLAARLLWSKGVGDYVDAARQLLREEPRCRFLLLGFVDSDHPDAVPRRRIEEWARDGIVEFHESLDDVRPYLREAHCVVLPSVYREGTPRSLLEAAATARPVITTDRPGCRTVVEHGRTGFLCRPGDRRDLLGRMQAMRDMPAAALAAFGGEARRKMEREFDESIVLARYIDAVERILVSRNPARSPS
jgi:glycosyltransferase involved in cell wall biosynthesis